MFSRLKGFLYRHRRKFIVTTVLIGGTAFAIRYAQRKLREYTEREGREFLERSRRQQHFKSLERTCDQTILSFAPSFHEAVMKAANTEDLIAELPSASEKVIVWEKLKIMAFTRIVVLVYVGSMLVLLLRVQLNVMGGYLVRDPNGEISTELHQTYLSLCHHLRDSGVQELCSLVERHVQPILDNVSLKQPMSLRGVEELFWSIQNSVEGKIHDNPIKNLGKYVFQLKEHVNVSSLNNEEVMQLHRMMSETMELLETDEVASLMRSCVSQGFGAVTDKLADHFAPACAPDSVPGPSSKQDDAAWSEAVNGAVKSSSFIHPNNVTKPMAKIIPIIDKLSEQVYSARDSLLHQLLRNDMVKVLGANIYEAFGQKD